MNHNKNRNSSCGEEKIRVLLGIASAAGTGGGQITE